MASRQLMLSILASVAAMALFAVLVHPGAAGSDGPGARGLPLSAQQAALPVLHRLLPVLQ